MLVENEAIDETFDFYMKYFLISCGTKQLLNMQLMIQKYWCKINSWRFVLQNFKTAVVFNNETHKLFMFCLVMLKHVMLLGPLVMVRVN